MDHFRPNGSSPRTDPRQEKFKPLPCLPGQVQWMGLKYITAHQSKTSLSLQVQQLNGFCRVVPCKNIGSPPGIQAHPTKIEIPNDSFLNEQTEAQGRLAQIRSVSFSKVVTV